MEQHLDARQRELPALADAIGREVEAAERSWRNAVGHAIRAGELLIEAKAQLGHGEWLPWLRDNFVGSRRSAQDYMRLARNGEDARRVAHLGVKGALKELAAPAEDDARSAAHSLPESVAEIKQMAASEAVNRLRLDHMREIIERFEAEKPTLDDFHREVAERFPDKSKRDRQWIAEGRHMLALIEHADDRREVLYRVVVANAGDLIAGAPVEGPPLVAKASTGIAFLHAQRQHERAPEGEYDDLYAAAQRAWMTHRAALDAYFRANGEPPMDERPLDFNDAMYHPALQVRSALGDEEAS
jgi:hypothetical protein